MVREVHHHRTLRELIWRLRRRRAGVTISPALTGDNRALHLATWDFGLSMDKDPACQVTETNQFSQESRVNKMVLDMSGGYSTNKMTSNRVHT